MSLKSNPKTKSKVKLVGEEIVVLNQVSDSEIERMVCSIFFAQGASLLDGYKDSITFRFFAEPVYRYAFSAMVRMRDDGLDIEEGIFEAYFRKVCTANADELWMEWFYGREVNVKAINVEQYVRALARLHQAREIQLAMADLWSSASSGMGDPELMIEQIRQRIDQCALAGVVSVGVEVGSIASSVVSEIERQRALGPHLSGVDTGFYQLNQFTQGWQPGDLSIIAAASSMGKTALMLSSAWATVKAYPDDHVFISTQEQSSEQIVQRLIAIETGINLLRLRAPYLLSEEEMRRIRETRDQIRDSKLILEDAVLGVDDLVNQWMRAQWKYGGIKAFYLDYIQYVARRGTRGPHYKDNEAIDYTVGQLKAFARRKGAAVPVIALSQVKREAVDRVASDPNQRFRKEDCDGSSSVEKDADNVFMIYRPSVYFPFPDSSRGSAEGYGKRAELEIAKQRNGPTGTIIMDFHATCAHFMDPKTYTANNLATE